MRNDGNTKSIYPAIDILFRRLMVKETKGRLSKRTDGKYIAYLPKNLAEDSAFPFKIESSIPVKMRLMISTHSFDMS